MKKISYEEMARPSAEEFAVMEKMPVTVILDNIRSLNNVGSFFRTCDAFAVEKLILCGMSGTPPQREIHKTALGAEDTVAWEYFPATADAIKNLAGQGYEVVAVEQVNDARRLSDFIVEADKKYALVFGNEVNGVGDEALGLCRGAVEIPQSGTKHSLNVSVAGGVVLWHFYNRLLCG